MFNKVKSDEPLVVETVNILIYREPGSGKTSFVNTAESSLTLDFDKGVHRTDFRKDVRYRKLETDKRLIITIYSLLEFTQYHFG